MTLIPKRMFWKIYLNSLLLLVLVTLAVSLVTVFVQPESRFHGRPEQLQKLLKADIEAVFNDPQKLQRTLQRISTALNRSLVIYSSAGQQIATVGDSLPPALKPEQLEKVGGWHPIHQDDGWVQSVSLNDGTSYLLIEGRGSGGLSFLIAISTVLLVVAILSWLLTRALTRPLERLTATSRSLAAGHLSTRSGLRRKDEVGELALALDEMAGNLEERINSEKELFANISHEIRTPLARLRVALELCEESPGDSGRMLKRLRDIGEDLSELEILIENVLTSARLDLGENRGNFPLKLRNVFLDDFFHAVEERFFRHHPNAQFQLQLEPSLPTAEIDAELLNRVCDNLLDNAVKYNSRNDPVVMDVSASATHFSVCVKDRGDGVEDADLQRLFEPFFRADRSRCRKSGGTGLGLALCKRIIIAHGGKISVKKNKEKGLSFQFTAPLSHAAKIPKSA
ncbi:HAMP domain-containing sensor histidine kinase [Pelobacter seleniigenes]|uniref:HAMP domain-containing sensor histidine kinase n=1 Tax=Pelobacter seleniigenes TaxID=407188 RepID=UPI00068B42F1|nr:HAMP domain-containing sensor histidine kinase [Pelobacter seleniigenes]